MTRNSTTRTSIKASKKLRRAVAYFGVCSKVARELGRSTTHVSLVARGLRRSRSVEAALLAEIKRVEKGAAA